jgi:hypothetical protein
MNNNQTNRVTMFKTVASHLDDNTPIWNGMAPMQTAVTEFKNKIAAIDASAQKQETPSGAADNKAAARDDLEDVLFLACEALGTLAHTNKDRDLAALVEVTPSSLDHLGEQELSNRATIVLAAATARKTELAALQVTQANLDELDQALQDFNASKEGPRQATTERMAQTESLPQLIREASEILRARIDRMVNLFRRTHPDFVAGYRGARVIVDRAASRATTRPTAPVQPTA